MLRKRTWKFWMLLIGIVLLGAAITYFVSNSDDNSSPKTDSSLSQPPTLNPDYHFVHQVDRDAIPAIDNPQFLTAEEAAIEYEPHELVIGLEIGGDARAYSIPVLSRHEIVNDVVGEMPVAITWCPLCFNAAVFRRDVEGQVLDFGVSGLLLNNLLVMYDRQTDSLWTPFDGTALQGPLMGEQLDFILSTLTTWEAWHTQYPHTLALAKNGISIDVYESYYNNADSGVTQGFDFDERLPPKSFVIGVSLENEAVAYPFSILTRLVVINDIVGTSPIVVTFMPESQTALVYDRRTDDQILTFTFDPETNTLTDDQTHSIWDIWQGVAIEGELEGQVLRRVISTRMFWFAWRDHQPQTTIYGQ